MQSPLENAPPEQPADVALQVPPLLVHALDSAAVKASLSLSASTNERAAAVAVVAVEGAAGTAAAAVTPVSVATGSVESSAHGSSLSGVWSPCWCASAVCVAAVTAAWVAALAAVAADDTPAMVDLTFLSCSGAVTRTMALATASSSACLATPAEGGEKGENRTDRAGMHVGKQRAECHSVSTAASATRAGPALPYVAVQFSVPYTAIPDPARAARRSARRTPREAQTDGHADRTSHKSDGHGQRTAAIPNCFVPRRADSPRPGPFPLSLTRVCACACACTVVSSPPRSSGLAEGAAGAAGKEASDATAATVPLAPAAGCSTPLAAPLTEKKRQFRRVSSMQGVSGSEEEERRRRS